jgi:hypothetical protein
MSKVLNEEQKEMLTSLKKIKDIVSEKWHVNHERQKKIEERVLARLDELLSDPETWKIK